MQQCPIDTSGERGEFIESIARRMQHEVHTLWGPRDIHIVHNAVDIGLHEFDRWLRIRHQQQRLLDIDHMPPNHDRAMAHASTCRVLDRLGPASAIVEKHLEAYRPKNLK